MSEQTWPGCDRVCHGCESPTCKAIAEAPAAPFALAFAELRAIVGPEKGSDLKRWKDRWIDEAGAPSALSREARGIAGIEEHIRRQQAATFGELLAARPGILARTERLLELGSVVFGAFLCAVRAEPKVPPGEAWLVKDGNVAVRIVNLATEEPKP